MHLNDLCAQLPPTENDGYLPNFLMGCFRRKSITFFNGTTDEKTIVYWFQSRHFTIDLRLTNAQTTPLLARQGWVGNTVWDNTTELLSWQITSSYQNHSQWPEPAKLHAIGNSILEFSPSNSYVEDWRQQATQGDFLGLRLYQARNLVTNECVALDGGLIMCGQYLVYAQSRLPAQQQIVKQWPTLACLDEKTLSSAEQAAISTYEVSVVTDGQHISYSTQTNRVNDQIVLDGFRLINDNTVVQSTVIDGIDYELSYHVDVWQPSYDFLQQTATIASSEQWLLAESKHLLHNAVITY